MNRASFALVSSDDGSEQLSLTIKLTLRCLKRGVKAHNLKKILHLRFYNNLTKYRSIDVRNKPLTG